MRSSARFVQLPLAVATLLLTGTMSWGAAAASGSGTSTPHMVTPEPPSLNPATEQATERAARFFDPLLADAQTDAVRANLLHQRGVLYLRSHYKQKAIADFNSALSLLPDARDERLGLLFHRACAYLLLPKPDADAAITDINICLGADPNDPEALLIRADAYRKLGKIELADADLARAAAITPKSDTPVRTLIKNAQDAVR
jgi:tetratricopeptide (TPR) repeat protein